MKTVKQADVVELCHRSLFIDLSALKDKFVVVNTAFSRREERSNTGSSTLSSLTTSPEQSRRTGFHSVFGWEKAGKNASPDPYYSTKTLPTQKLFQLFSHHLHTAPLSTPAR